jgi:glycosyltransferase involved in cell wall biosynthesis
MSSLSIIIPYFQDFENLIICMKSIQNSYLDLDKNKKAKIEVIIVDDASKKQIKNKHLNEFSFKKIIIRHKLNKGAGAARNSGLRKSNYNFALFLDSDVQLDRLFLKNSFLEIKKNPNKSIFSCPQSFIPGNKNPNIFQKYLAYSWFINQTRDFKKNEMVTSFCMLVKKKYFLDTGCFSENFKSAGGEEFQLSKSIHFNKIIRSTKLICYHFQDKFLLRIKKLIKRAQNFPSVLIKNKKISNLTKVKFSFCAISSFCIPFFLIFSFLSSMPFYIFFIFLLILIITEKNFFIFIFKRESIFLFMSSIIFKIAEYLAILLGILIGYVKKV